MEPYVKGYAAPVEGEGVGIGGYEKVYEYAGDGDSVATFKRVMRTLSQGFQQKSG